MKIAVIGGGISGIAAARTLKRFGHEAIVFEKGTAIGGVWAVAYPGVTLQNTAETYRISDFPWPFPVDLHPRGTDVLAYLEAAIVHFGLDVRTSHEVVAMDEQRDGWRVTIDTPGGRITDSFDHVVVAAGHYTQKSNVVTLGGRDRFAGDVLTEYDITDLDIFKGRRVAVVGFGKTAVDMACFALPRAASVTHVFRAPRWLIPYRFGNKHMVDVVSRRSSTIFEPAWTHPGRFERLLHDRFGWIVRRYGAMVDAVVAKASGLSGGRTPDARERLRLVTPELPLQSQMRGTMAPEGYYAAVAEGRIAPVRGEMAELSETALILKDGRAVPADLVVLALGHGLPDFPYLPERYRALMTAERDGTPLFRHLIHPDIPHLSFAGFNHGFLHVPGVELGMIWVGALLRGDIVLPSRAKMLESAEHVHAWKRENTMFEPTRAYLISNHFHQHFDVLLGDLGVTPWRKANRMAEFTASYGPADYAGVFDEYERARGKPRHTLPLDT